MAGSTSKLDFYEYKGGNGSNDKGFVGDNEYDDGVGGNAVDDLVNDNPYLQ